MQRFLSHFGMLIILLALCGLLSVLTLAEQVDVGAPAGEELGQAALRQFGAGASVVIVAGEGLQDGPFAVEAARVLTAGSAKLVATVKGSPRAARLELEKLAKKGVKVDVIVASARAGKWAVLEDAEKQYPGLGPVKLMTPRPYVWPNFLKADNLRNISNQIAIIAILAIGMTMVILAGGIDLSVGSIIALSAILTALFIHDFAGATEATPADMVLWAAAAIGICALLGLVNGLVVTMLDVPAFIATLGMMLVASGLAHLISREQSIYELPESIVWLGRGADLLGIPNAVVLMLALYAVAHIVMTRTTLGRHIYAVGGNREAARLSGVAVKRVLIIVYVICASLAALGGVVMVSLFRGAMPTYGDKYELYVVAAVVLGGTSINGGEGNVLQTLVGAFIIAVIQNGMNLMGFENAMQLVALGTVIVAAVAADRLKHRLSWGGNSEE